MKKCLLTAFFAAFLHAPLQAFDLSGQWRYDILSTLKQHNNQGQTAADSLMPASLMSVTRARLEMHLEPIAFWHYNIRIQQHEYENNQFDLDFFHQQSSQIGYAILPSTAAWMPEQPLEIARFSISYTGLDVIALEMGLIQAPELSCTQLSSQALVGSNPSDRQIGSVIRATGNHAGLKVIGQVQGLRYELGVWKQTPYHPINCVPPYQERTILDARELDQIADGGAVDLISAQRLLTTTDAGPVLSDIHRGPIRWAYGGRVNWVADLPYNVFYSAALGYSHAPLNVPILAATFGAFDNLIIAGGTVADLDAPNYTMTSYDYLTQATFDFNWASTIVHSQLGYQYQKLHIDTTDHYYTAQTPVALAAETAAAEAFNNTPKTSSCWAQWGMLLWGGRYTFDQKKGVVSGVDVQESRHALEFVVRGGMVLRKNVMALLSQTGFDDYSSVDKNSPVAAADPRLDLGSTVVFDEQNRYFLLLINNAGKSAQDLVINNVSIVSPNDRGIAYQSRQISWGFSLNYYPADRLAFKLSYQLDNSFFKKEVSQDWQPSLFVKNRHELRLRCEASF